MLYYFEGGVAVKKRTMYFLYLVIAGVLLAGCSMQTVDQMYMLPKRSENYSNLQSVIDTAMHDLAYSAPLAGENQQSVQMADVDGDGEQEYLVFAKGMAHLPLRILVFDKVDDKFLHIDTIESNGASFDQVEYVHMDENPGLELIVGRQVSDQLVRSVSIYTFAGGEAEQLMTANYQKFITVDMNGNGRSELLVLRPGQAASDTGVAELYTMKTGIIERSNEVSMSAPVDKLKRILVGSLQDGKTAVYVASAVEDTSLITDVFTQNDELLTNASLSSEPGTNVQTLRNYYIYADDMDNDGVLELPRLVAMQPLEDTPAGGHSDLILWYAMESNGNTVDKLYTYYDAADGWYLELEESLAKIITVRRLVNVFEFYVWDETGTNAWKLMTVYTLTGQNREEQSVVNGRFVLLKTDTVTYAASLEAEAANYQITQDSLIRSFYLIHRDWNTGET